MSGPYDRSQAAAASRPRRSSLHVPGTQPARQSTPSRPVSGASRSSRATADDNHTVGRSKSHSMSSGANLSTSKSTSAQSQRKPMLRTVPPWVASVETDDAVLAPKAPNDIHTAHHLWVPSPKPNTRQGGQFDHLRSAEPVTMKYPIQQHASRWREFAVASSPRPLPDAESQHNIVNAEWMKENWADLDEPWEPEVDPTDGEADAGFWLLNASQRKARRKGIYRAIMKNPMVPLVVRVTVLTFCALALGLAGTIFSKTRSFNRSNPELDCATLSSTYLAIIVDSIAIIYIVYITQEEYTSKPLGLRSHRAKMRLIFMDLIFIVFASANLSLAFESLTDDNWACRADPSPGNMKVVKCPVDADICSRQKALTATLLIALCAWLATFAISTLRLIERVAR